jgi:hypothetical protein
MRVETVDVTPEQARAWLDAASEQIRQRHPTANRVSAYAHAMERGQWRVTHQAIAIADDGVLIDGQHRLLAVIRSHMPAVRMSVAFDVPRDTFDTIDSGLTRSTASVLHIGGIADANVTAAAARLTLVYGEIAGSRRLPSAEVRQLFTTRDVIDFVTGERGEIMRQVIPKARAIAAALGRNGMRSWMTSGLTLILESQPGDGLFDDFVERFESGAGLSVGAPLLTLRRWLLSESGYPATTNAYRGAIGAAALIKTWNAWTDGVELRQIRFRPGKETWPAVGDAPTLDIPAGVDDVAPAVA